jgi:hypothetical protein
MLLEYIPGGSYDEELLLRAGNPNPGPPPPLDEGGGPRGKSDWSGINEGGGDWCEDDTGKNG